MAVTAVPPAAASSAPAAIPHPPRLSWGLRFMMTADRWLPEPIYRPLRALGALVAMVVMPEARRNSRAYLAVMLPQPPRWGDVFRHFFAFQEALMFRLRVAGGRHAPCTFDANAAAFCAWMQRGEPVLLGTMHIGASDTLGFQLAVQSCRPVYLVRQKWPHSQDVEALAAQMGGAIRFIWVNQPGDLLFALKEAAAAEGAIALQCDRLGFSSRNEPFEFLGARRLFPFTIYHLALIFGRPVILTVGVPEGKHASRLYASPRFVREPGESKAAALARARGHFQDFLRLVEGLLRAQPLLWFNFTPLNPSVPGDSRPPPA